MRAAYLLASLFLSGQALASPKPSACEAVEHIGCFFAPSSIRQAREPVLLVYMRGHWGSHAGSVPASALLASSRQAFAKFALGELAEREGLAVLVTGSSDVSVRPDDLSNIEKSLELKFKRLYLAAHSGGNVGLAASLPALRTPDRIVMLDNFYFAEGLSRAIQAKVQAGTVCTGYYTKHNEDRWAKRFKPFVYCPVDNHEDYGHDAGVNRCLGSYLRETACP